MKKKILFIEDEKFLLRQLPIALTNYEIVPAESASKGLKLVESEDFDAVLLDIMMPPSEDMDLEVVDYGMKTGVEICKRIKQAKQSLPVVVLTVVRDREILREIRKEADSIVHKPVRPKEIDDALSKVLTNKE